MSEKMKRLEIKNDPYNEFGKGSQYYLFDGEVQINKWFCSDDAWALHDLVGRDRDNLLEKYGSFEVLHNGKIIAIFRSAPKTDTQLALEEINDL